MATVTHNIGAAETGENIGQWVKSQTIAVAERTLQQEVGRGFDSKPVVVTDGMPRRDYAQVKPFGKIEFIANTSMADAVRWALTELQKKSPVRTGRYASSHFVMINGAEVRGNIWGALRAVQPTDRVQIVNPQPYAKKIEGRKSRSKGRGASRTKTAAIEGLSPQARRGVYERVVLPMLVRRYGRSLFFDFKYVKLSLGVKSWGVTGGGANRKRVLRDQVYPALQFFIKPTGLSN